MAFDLSDSTTIIILAIVLVVAIMLFTNFNFPGGKAHDTDLSDCITDSSACSQSSDNMSESVDKQIGGDDNTETECQPFDSGDMFAPFQSTGKTGRITGSDLLPKETNKDWFGDTGLQPIKNPSLISSNRTCISTRNPSRSRGGDTREQIEVPYDPNITIFNQSPRVL